jgi:ADP-ribosylglycohydrolase
MVEFELAGSPYELRCARVEAIGGRVLVPRYVSPKSSAPSTPVLDPGELPLDERVDRFTGTLLGGALGDSLGAPVEFLTLSEIRRKYGENGIEQLATAYGRVGAITDDTQMTLFTAEGLLRAHNRAIDKGIVHIPSMLRFAYARWLSTQGEPEPLRAIREELHHPSPDGWLVSLSALHDRRAPGNTCLSGAASTRMGTIDEPLNSSKGCGAVMRAAPVGLAPLIDPFSEGCEIGALTHGHPSGYLTAGALALITRRLVCGVGLEDALDETVIRLRDALAGEECVDALERGRELGRGVPTPERIEMLGAGWVAEEALAIGVCCALAADDFVSGIRLAANHGGDSDSTAAIAGNLLGAKLGRSALPKDWIEQLELRDAIEQLGEDLALHHEEPESGGFFDSSYGDEDRYPGW